MRGMSQGIFQLLSHFIFIYVTFNLLLRNVAWDKFLKVSAENERQIRLLIIFFAIALGYLVSLFFLSIVNLGQII